MHKDSKALKEYFDKVYEREKNSEVKKYLTKKKKYICPYKRLKEIRNNLNINI